MLQAMNLVANVNELLDRASKVSGLTPTCHEEGFVKAYMAQGVRIES